MVGNIRFRMAEILFSTSSSARLRSVSSAQYMASSNMVLLKPIAEIVRMNPAGSRGESSTPFIMPQAMVQARATLTRS